MASKTRSPLTARALFQRPSVAVVVGGQWVSSAGDAAARLALSWFVLSLTGSRLDLEYLGAVQAAAGVLMLGIGVYVDRWDRRRTMIGSALTELIAYAVLGVLALDRILPFPMLLVLVIVAELAGSTFAPAAFAYLPHLVERSDLPALNGLMRAARTSARLVGQAVAGELLAIIGSPFLFLANALSFGAAVASLSIIRTGSARPVSPSRKRPQFWAELREGLALINAHAFLRRTVMGDIVWGFFAVALTTLDVAWVRQVLHQGAIAYAAFWIAQGIGALVGSLVAAGIVARFAVIRIQWLTTAATGALIVVLALVPHLVPDLFIMAAFGIALGVRATVLHTAVQLLVLTRYWGVVWALWARSNRREHPWGPWQQDSRPPVSLWPLCSG
jgi:MFS family permease